MSLSTVPSLSPSRPFTILPRTSLAEIRERLPTGAAADVSALEAIAILRSQGILGGRRWARRSKTAPPSHQAVLQCAGLIMTCFHRGEGISNDAPRCRCKVGVLQGDLKFRLDVILATFDFVDDRFGLGGTGCGYRNRPKRFVPCRGARA